MSPTAVCPICHSTFAVNYTGKKFCSRACFHESQKTLVEIPCATCGKLFMPEVSRQRFCSQPCAAVYRASIFRNRVILTCEFCGKDYEQKPSLAETSHFCGRPCYHASMSASGRVTLACKVCGKEFERLTSRQGEYCSYTCMGFDDRTRITKTCEVCGKEYEAIPSRAEQSRYCSDSCRQHGWGETVRKYIGKRGPTSIEVKLAVALAELGIDFTPEQVIGRWVVDFALSDGRTIIEADGDYWHSLPQSIARDVRKDAYLIHHGYTVLHITESEINNATSLPEFVREKLATNQVLP